VKQMTVESRDKSSTIRASSFWPQRWRRKILTRTGCHFPAKLRDGDDKVGDASGKHGLDCSSLGQLLLIFPSQENRPNPSDRPNGRSADVLSFQLKDRIR